MRRSVILAAAVLALVPAVARAHVSIHPNVLPAGGFATVNVRVPNERDGATVTQVRMQMPPGLISVTAQSPTGWSVVYKMHTLAKPIQTDDGPVASEVSEVDWSAARGAGIPPGRFLQFPVSLSTPDREGAVVGFPTLQTYSDGTVVRWIGPPSNDAPAPTIDVSKAGGPMLDVTGGDAGPPASAARLTLGGGATRPEAASSLAGAGQGLSIAALIVAILALLAGGAALLRVRARTPER